MYGHELVDHLFPLRPPEGEHVAQLMDELRADFTALGHKIAERVPQGPDQTVAIRKTHEALMATIAATALNQEGVQP